MLLEVKPGLYRHFKGRDYEIFGTYAHTETGEIFVAYQALYAPYTHYVRPHLMFVEEIDRPEIPYKGPRFTYVRPL